MFIRCSYQVPGQPGPGRTTFISLLMALLLFFTAISVLSPACLYADNTINKLADVQDKLQSTIEQVKKVRKKEGSLKSRLERINSSIKNKKTELKGFDRKIAGSRAEINKYSGELRRLNKKFAGRKEYLKELLYSFYKRQYGGNALVLVSAKDYQDLIRKSKYVSLVAHHDGAIVEKYAGEIRGIKAKKDRLEDLRRKLSKNRDNIRKKQKVLESDRRKKDKLLAMVKARRTSFEANIKKMEASSKKLREMVRKLETRSIPKAILGRGFRALKGSMPWPVDGKIVIPYGNYEDPLYRIKVFRKGIEISAQQGDILRSVAGGRVVYAGSFSAYGKLLIIDHGSGYHSLYRNLSDIFFEKGDLLIKRTDIGKINKPEKMENPTLYFEIRYRGKPVNPMNWLAKK